MKTALRIGTALASLAVLLGSATAASAATPPPSAPAGPLVASPGALLIAPAASPADLRAAGSPGLAKAKGCVPSPASGCVTNTPGDDLPTWFMSTYWRGSALQGFVAKPPQKAEVRVTTRDRRRVLARAPMKRNGDYRVTVPRASLSKKLVLRLVTPDGTEVTHQHAPTRPAR